MSATASPPLMNCPACGYDLRVMSTVAGETPGQGRCPECGEIVNAEQWRATQLAWEHRRTLSPLGKAWVFLKTVTVAIRQPYRLATLAPYGVREGSAAAVAWPCLFVSIALAALAGYLCGELLHVNGGFNSRTALGYVWEVGVDAIWPLAVAAPLWMLLLARASYEAVLLGTRASGADARKRALSVAPFLLAGLVMIAVGLLASALVLKYFPFLINLYRARGGPAGKFEVLQAATLLSIALTGIIVGLLTLLAGPVVVSRGLGAASRPRAAAVLLFLLIALPLSALLTVGAIPFSLGLYRLLQYSGLG